MPFPILDLDTLSKLYPSDLLLKQVTLIHRHGERTPIYPSNYPFLTDTLWKKCHLQPDLHALYSAAEISKPQYLSTNPQHETPHLFSKVISKGHAQTTPLFKAIEQLNKIQGNGLCFYGQLTDLGKENMKLMGTHLRLHYTERLKFLSLEPNPSETHVRSTDFARTIESVQYLLSGLYPKSGSSLPVHIHHQETMYPDYAECESLRKLSKEFRNAQIPYMIELAAPIVAKLKQEKIQVDLNGKSIHTLFDTLACMDAHNAKLPQSINMNDLQTLEKACVQYWWQVYHDVDQIGKLSIGRFLNEIIAETDLMIHHESQAKKLIILSGHDSTIAPILGALKLFDRQHPPFGAILNLELFQHAKNPQQYYMRLLYNGTPLQLPNCAQPNNHYPGQPTLCTYEAFKQTVQTAIPQNYTQDCSTL